MTRLGGLAAFLLVAWSAQDAGGYAFLSRATRNLSA
jgi:hypothetical protein